MIVIEGMNENKNEKSLRIQHKFLFPFDFLFSSMLDAFYDCSVIVLPIALYNK